jgi:LysM repeat protein
VDLAAPSITYTPLNEPGHATPTRPGSPAAAAVTPARPVAEVTSVSTYTVGRGDSLWSIANKNHLTVAELAKANNLNVGVALRPGQKLLIPGGKTVAAPKELAAVAPATGKAATPAPARAGDAMTYTVLPGESLGAIARKFQVKTGELAAANSITDPSKVRAGQQLVIPGFKAVGTKTSASAPAGKATAAETSAASTTPTATTPHFEIAAPPPGQDLDSGLKGTGTEVPTVKVEDAQPPKK